MKLSAALSQLRRNSFRVFFPSRGHWMVVALVTTSGPRLNSLSMLAAVRRGPSLSRALRVGALGVPQSVRATSPLVTRNLQRPSSARLVTNARSFHWTSPVRQSSAAAAAPASEHQERITEFNDLATKGLVNPNLIYAVTKGMKLSTMTDVQSLTIPEVLNGGDV